MQAFQVSFFFLYKELHRIISAVFLFATYGLSLLLLRLNFDQLCSTMGSTGSEMAPIVLRLAGGTILSIYIKLFC